MLGTELLLVVVPLFVIVDPFASLGLFIGLTEGRDRQRTRIAVKAAAFATAVLVFFAAAGRETLAFLGIELYALRLAGGLLLVMIGLRMLREGREIPRSELRAVHLPTGGAKDLDEDDDPSFVPLGLPMLAGPGAISLVIVHSTRTELSVVALGIALVMAASLLVLMMAGPLRKVLRETGTRVITRIMGILTVAFAAQYFLDGIGGWLDARGEAGAHVIAAVLALP